MTQEGAGPSSPFWPSSARTNTGGLIPSDFFMDSKLCGECHKDIYEQWNGSMHHFASFNNRFYRKTIEHMQELSGTRGSKWCAGCHDHAVFFNGRFDRPIKEQVDTPEAQNGLGCVSCHSIVHVGGSMGNGDFLIQYPPLHRLASSHNPWIRRLDYFLTYLNPEPHRRTFMKAFMRQDSAEYCSSCHKVHLDEPVNHYRWLRGFNEYDNWQASGVSGQGARSFYYPAKPSTCSDCHMPLLPSRDPGNRNGMIHSHRFPAANTAVAFVNNDAKQLRAEEQFLQSGFITVDLFAAGPVDEAKERTEMRRAGFRCAGHRIHVRGGRGSGTGGAAVLREWERWPAPSGRPAYASSRARPCAWMRWFARARSGIFFPPARWSVRRLAGIQGVRCVRPDSGLERARGGRGQRPCGTRRALLSFVSDRWPGQPDQQTKCLADSQRAVCPADSARRGRYGPLPSSDSARRGRSHHAGDQAQLSQVCPYYTKFAFAGVAKPGPRGPGLRQPRVHLRFGAEYLQPADRHTLPCHQQGGTGEAGWEPIVRRQDRERWNDWGIGLLLQGDLKAAEYAFRRVTEAEPEYADGWLNVGRALIQEGETDRARPFVEKALALDRTWPARISLWPWCKRPPAITMAPSAAWRDRTPVSQGSRDNEPDRPDIVLAAPLSRGHRALCRGPWRSIPKTSRRTII